MDLFLLKLFSTNICEIISLSSLDEVKIIIRTFNKCLDTYYEIVTKQSNVDKHILVHLYTYKMVNILMYY